MIMSTSFEIFYQNRLLMPHVNNIRIYYWWRNYTEHSVITLSATKIQTLPIHYFSCQKLVTIKRITVSSSHEAAKGWNCISKLCISFLIACVAIFYVVIFCLKYLICIHITRISTINLHLCTKQANGLIWENIFKIFGLILENRVLPILGKSRHFQLQPLLI